MIKSILPASAAFFVMASLLLGACTLQPTAPQIAEKTVEKTRIAAGESETQATVIANTPAANQFPQPANPWETIDPSGQSIIFWHDQTQGRQDMLNEIAADFSNTNQWGITIDAEYQGNSNKIYNKFLGVLDTPDAPALITAYQDQAATYQLFNGLNDLNSLIDSSNWGLPELDQKDFFQGIWQQDIFPGNGNARIGLPASRSMDIVYYNQDWLRELGYDSPPTTPAQFKEMACKASKQAYSKATAGNPIGYELSNSATQFASWTFAFGGDVFDYNTNQYTYNSSAALDAMAFVQDLFRSGCASMAAKGYDDQTDFGNGKLLFSVGSSSSLSNYQTAIDGGAKFSWKVAAIPHTTPDPVMNVYGTSISIPKTTPEQELAAWIFLKYFTTPDVQAEWAQASGYFPVRASAANGLREYFTKNPAYKTAFGWLKFAHFEPAVPGYDIVRNKASEALAAIAKGDEVKTTLDNLNQEANTILIEKMKSARTTPVLTRSP